MRKLHAPLVAVVVISLPLTAIAADGVASAGGKWNIARPASTPQNRSWSSPIAAAGAQGAADETRRVVGNAFGNPRRYSAATEWTTRAVIFALAATGNIMGGGRDDTADIGKRPLPPLRPDVAPFGSFSGGIH